MSLEPGQILDNKYRIVRLIGEGGMGSVHEGENTLIARRVAIKVLHAAGNANEQVLTRFEREAQAAGRIGSDHILEVLDLGTLENGDRYMVMEYLDGEALSDRIARGRMAPQEIARLMRQALKGLQAAHDAGIIHRDLKPDNIYVLREKAGQPDFVKIIDFGISKFSALGSDMSMTRTGAVMGTPYYMSPEQAKGSGQVDPRSDVYAIGVIMYEAVSGNVPFDGNTFNELMFKIVLSEPPPLSDVAPDLDPAFVQIINRAMARELEQRYSSAVELMQALDAYLAGQGAGVATPLEGVPVPGTAATGGSGGAWSNTNNDLTVPKKSAVPLAIAAGIGLLVVAGGAVAAFSLGGGGDEDAAAAASGSAVPAASAIPTPEPEPEQAPEASPEPEPAASTPAPSSKPEEPAASPPKVAAPVAKRSPRPIVRPKPKPEPASKPKPKPQPASGTDFGY